MSTLKKILALTLALAMVLSLNVFATFKDQDLIDEDCASACTLMDDLGVLKGDNGNMKPEDPITRAEVATMIYRVMNKGKDDSSNYKGMKLFTDVKEGKWYEGYINYCATMELVSGVGNGKFNPNGLVKGTEVLKMLLGCLGYKGPHANFTGSGWANRVIAQADEIGLIDEYAPALTANAPRQWVAYLFEKAMYCDMVKWDNDAEEFVEKTPVQTLGKNKFGLKTLTGVVTDINYHEADEKPVVKFTVGGVEFEKFDIDTALYGQEVNVTYKLNSDGTTKDKVYGVTATGKSVVATANIVDLKGEVKGDVYKITADTKTLEVKTALVSFVTEYATVSDGKVTAKNYPGTVTLVSSDGKKWDYACATLSGYDEYKVDTKGKVSVFTTSSVTAEELAKKYNVVGELADKDYVKGTCNYPVGCTENFGKLPTIEKFEKQTLKLTKVAGTKYTLGGTVYQQMEDVHDLDSAVLGSEYDVYVDGGLVVKATVAAGEKATALSENLALVLKAAPAKQGTFDADKNMVRVLLLNGETKDFEYKDITGTNAADYKAWAKVYDSGNSTIYANVADTVVEYVLDGEKITFKDHINMPEKSDGSTNYSLDDDKSGVVTLKNNYIGTTNTVRFDANAKFFTKTGEGANAKYAVMTMADFTGDFNLADGDFVKYSDGKTIATYVAGVMKFTYKESAAKYAIATGNSYTELVDDKPVTRVDVALQDGTTTTLTLAEGTATKNKVYTYTVSNGKATLSAPVAMPTSSNDVLKFVQGNEIAVGELVLTVKDDAVIIVADKDGNVAFKTLADLVAVDDYTMRANPTVVSEKVTVLLVSYVKTAS